ncbi:MAG: branched-chain amino acid ABC transporter permease [Candidatus Dormibacterales bacterium]
MEQAVPILILGAVESAVVALAAVGLTLQFGVTNYLNFGYTELLTFGAFVALMVNVSVAGLNVWLAMAIAGVLTAALGVALNLAVFARFARRARDPFTVLIVTFLVGFMLNQIYIVGWGPNTYELRPGTDRQLLIGGLSVGVDQLLFVLIAAACMVGLEVLLHFTRIGRSMRAVSDNRSLAAACGLDTPRITNITWAISGFMGGLAGVILALQVRAFDVTLGDSFLYLIYPAVVIGGIGRPVGALVAGILIGVFAALGSIVVTPAISTAVIFAGMILMVILRPQGILGGGRHPSLREA